MCYRLAMVVTIAFACCCSSVATAQVKIKKKKGGDDVGFPAFPSRAMEEAPTRPGPAFLLTLEETTKLRKVFLPRTDIGPGGAANEPYVVTINTVRRIQGDEAAKVHVHVRMPGGGLIPEDDVRKLIQFRKDFAKKVAPRLEHVETARLTLSCHGITFNFNLNSGECLCGPLQVPDGFFDALSDALGDLEKLKAGKPSFDVK